MAAGTITKLSGWRWIPEQGGLDKTQVTGVKAYAVQTSTVAGPRTLALGVLEQGGPYYPSRMERDSRLSFSLR